MNPRDLAPDFTLLGSDNLNHSLSDYLGHWVLLYFYPKDDTPGCTQEACEIRDAFDEYEQLGVIVLGVSTDSLESHQKFATKHDLPFTLLSDPDKTVINAYHANSPLGTKRISYLINPQGQIHKIYPNVKPENHAQEVLEELR